MKRNPLSRYSRLKKQRQMEQRKELAIWALEVTGWGWATVWVPTVLMACPMALATMAAMPVMAHMEYGRDLWVVAAQDQRGPQNLLDLVMDSDMVDLDMEALDMVDLEAMGLAMASMAMVSTVDTFGRDLRTSPLPNQLNLGPRDRQALTMALAWGHTMASAMVVMVWEGYMGTVSTVDISGKGLLRIQNHRWKLEKRGLRTLTMALALAHTMALGMAWEVFMAGMEASMDMASGDALWRRVSQRQGKAK